MVRVLLARSAPLFHVNDRGDTPLHAAVAAGDLPIMVQLLDRGAPPLAKNALRLTPVDLANQTSPAAADLLRQYLGGDGTMQRSRRGPQGSPMGGGDIEFHEPRVSNTDGYDHLSGANSAVTAAPAPVPAPQPTELDGAAEPTAAAPATVARISETKANRPASTAWEVERRKEGPPRELSGPPGTAGAPTGPKSGPKSRQSGMGYEYDGADDLQRVASTKKADKALEKEAKRQAKQAEKFRKKADKARKRELRTRRKSSPSDTSEGGGPDQDGIPTAWRDGTPGDALAGKRRSLAESLKPGGLDPEQHALAESIRPPDAVTANGQGAAGSTRSAAAVSLSNLMSLGRASLPDVAPDDMPGK